jgi:hypothetical protein
VCANAAPVTAPDIFDTIHEYKQFGVMVADGLVHSSFGDVRAATATGFGSFCRAFSSSLSGDRPFMFFCQLMLDLLPGISSSAKLSSRCVAYFDLLISMFKGASPSALKLLLTQGGGKALIQSVVGQISQSNSSSSSSSSSSSNAEAALCGLLSFCNMLLVLKPDLKSVAGPALVTEVFSNCLFALPDAPAGVLENAPLVMSEVATCTTPSDVCVAAASEGPFSKSRCKSDKSRQIAFDVLTNLNFLLR